MTSTHSIPPQFAVILNTIRELTPKIAAIQQNATTPGSALNNYVDYHTCYNVFMDLVRRVRNAACDAQNTGDFILHNIFRQMQDQSISSNTKRSKLAQVRDAIGTKRQNFLEPRARLQSFQRLFTSAQSSAILVAFNPVSISQQIITVDAAFASIDGMYMKIGEFLSRIEQRLGQGEITATHFEVDLTWLAAISADLKRFQQQVNI
ncbi:hypothetical protein QCA50_013541 [Cerrena zonata]|uniref:Uncharacterized protein n=1 Tax=Cerrena zonata TaxID=2478898 RepID=A0AAW0FUT8_9APHY